MISTRNGFKSAGLNEHQYLKKSENAQERYNKLMKNRKKQPDYVINDFKSGESWRLFKIMGEFVEGIDALHGIGPQ